MTRSFYFSHSSFILLFSKTKTQVTSEWSRDLSVQCAEPIKLVKTILIIGLLGYIANLISLFTVLRCFVKSVQSVSYHLRLVLNQFEQIFFSVKTVESHLVLGKKSRRSCFLKYQVMISSLLQLLNRSLFEHRMKFKITFWKKLISITSFSTSLLQQVWNTLNEPTFLMFVVVFMIWID